MPFEKGHIPWNKGLTKETSEKQRKAAEKTSTTRKRLFAEGKLKVSWEGKKCPGKGGRKPGFTSPNKGKTWDEYYGEEKATRMRKNWHSAIEDYWGNNDAWNKGKPLPEDHPLWNHMYEKGQTPWNKGLNNIHSEEGLRAIGDIWRGKNLSDEHKENISKALKGKKHNVSLANREKLSRLMKARRLGQVLPRKDSKIELMLQSRLDENNLKYEKHYPIMGQPDIAFPEKKIAMFCDGDYWHDYPHGTKRDDEVNKILTKEGWKVLRFWERDIHDNLDEIINEVMGCVFNG